jgi:hypothetical protein
MEAIRSVPDREDMTSTTSIGGARVPRVDDQRWATPAVDPQWWTSASFEGGPIREALARRDMAVVFRFLRTRGFSVTAITVATGLSANRVRAVMRGRQNVTSYDVLQRIAEGLSIDLGLMGLAYTTPGG